MVIYMIEKLKEERKSIEKQKNDILYIAVRERRNLSEQESMEIIVLQERVININKEIKRLSGGKKNDKNQRSKTKKERHD